VRAANAPPAALRELSAHEDHGQAGRRNVGRVPEPRGRARVRVAAAASILVHRVAVLPADVGVVLVPGAALGAAHLRRRAGSVGPCTVRWPSRVHAPKQPGHRAVRPSKRANRLADSWGWAGTRHTLQISKGRHRALCDMSEGVRTTEHP